MEIDPNSSIQEMIESCGSLFSGLALPSYAQQCIYLAAESQGGGMGGMMQDLAFAIPGVDEAMGFAEIMK